MKPYYRKATWRDGLELARNLKEDDRQEVLGLGHSPVTLPLLIQLSEPCISFFTSEGDLAGIGGITPGESPEIGVVWMLCTPEVSKHPTALVRGVREWLDNLKGYKLLWNITDARNTFHHRFLKLLGFKAVRVINTHPYFLPYYEIVKLCASH